MKLGCLKLLRLLQTERCLGDEQFPCDGIIKDEVQKWLREQHISFYHQGLKKLIMLSVKCLKKYRNYVEK
jgi:hypothetical protein